MALARDTGSTKLPQDVGKLGSVTIPNRTGGIAERDKGRHKDMALGHAPLACISNNFSARDRSFDTKEGSKCILDIGLCENLLLVMPLNIQSKQMSSGFYLIMTSITILWAALTLTFLRSKARQEAS